MKKGKITINKIALVLISFSLGLFFVLGWGVHNFFSNLPIKLHFCNHLACIFFSLIWFLFAGIGIFLLTRKTKFKKYRYVYIIMGIILILGIILMNIIVCDVNGNMSFKSVKEMFTTYPETTQCGDICQDQGWDIGSMTKIPSVCLEDGDLFVRDNKEMLISKSLYISPCCCYNVDTCEDLGYISRDPEADFSRYEEVEAGKLICWKLKTIPEPKIICCEMFNLDKTGEKTDIAYDLITEEECNGMLDIYDGVDIVDESLCEK